MFLLYEGEIWHGDKKFYGFTAGYVILGLQISIGMLWGYKNL